MGNSNKPGVIEGYQVRFTEKCLTELAVLAYTRKFARRSRRSLRGRNFQWWRAGQTNNIRRNGSRAPPCIRSSVR